MMRLSPLEDVEAPLRQAPEERRYPAPPIVFAQRDRGRPKLHQTSDTQAHLAVIELSLQPHQFTLYFTYILAIWRTNKLSIEVAEEEAVEAVGVTQITEEVVAEEDEADTTHSKAQTGRRKRISLI
jgi:hypothetical protein